MERWICPVCKTHKGSSGPFASDWALACHVAGKVRADDRLHRSWVLANIPEECLRYSVPKMAARLLLFVVEAQPVEPSSVVQTVDSMTPLIQQIRQIEMKLHGFICERLRERFGEREDEWWVQGVPLLVRQECAKRREEDPKRLGPCSYTDLIDLKTILDKNWEVFQKPFTKIDRWYNSKGAFLAEFNRLNRIRNAVMHPVRGEDPSGDDQAFIEQFLTVTEEVIG